MTKWFLAVLLLSTLCWAQAGPNPDQNCAAWGAAAPAANLQCNTSGPYASGTQQFLPDIRGTITNQFEIVVIGTAPASLTTTVVGCMRGGTCSGTLASSSGTSSQIVAPTAANLNIYDKYGVTLSWTGGDATTRFVVNRSGTVARLQTGAAGSGTVSANNGSAGAVAFYSAAGGSTTVGPDPNLTDNGAGALTSAQGTITASAPFQNHTVTWNNGAVSFSDYADVITCTAAAANSIPFQVVQGGSVLLGLIFGGSTCASPQAIVPVGTAGNPSIRSSLCGNCGLYIDNSGAGPFTCFDANGQLGPCDSAAGDARLASSAALEWTNTGLPSGAVSGTFDTALTRGAAGIVSVDTTTKGNGLGTVRPGLYASTSNCAAVGTAANPSVASCSAAPAGSFSCATNASTGTCVVNTTAVTANSEIFLTQRADTTTGTRLGVTCNTTLSTVITQVTAVTAGTSFTINLGTIATNPECFSYFIVN